MSTVRQHPIHRHVFSVHKDAHESDRDTALRVAAHASDTLGYPDIAYEDISLIGVAHNGDHVYKVLGFTSQGERTGTHVVAQVDPEVLDFGPSLKDESDELTRLRQRVTDLEAEIDEANSLLIHNVPEDLVCLAMTRCVACGETSTAMLGTTLKAENDRLRHEIARVRGDLLITRQYIASTRRIAG